MMGEFIPHAEHGGFLHPYPLSKIPNQRELNVVRTFKKKMPWTVHRVDDAKAALDLNIDASI